MVVEHDESIKKHVENETEVRQRYDDPIFLPIHNNEKLANENKMYLMFQH